MLTDEIIIEHTKKWITDVVIGCNFCPFASREMKRNSIQYVVTETKDMRSALEALARVFLQLDEDIETETTLLIFSEGFGVFSSYLQLVELAQSLLEKEGYEGIYQLASFHPEYLFAGTTAKDPANYTNRSPYPMLHLLREESLSRAIDKYPGAENIPQKNINYATEKGLVYMQLLMQACTK